MYTDGFKIRKDTVNGVRRVVAQDGLLRIQESCLRVHLSLWSLSHARRAGRRGHGVTGDCITLTVDGTDSYRVVVGSADDYTVTMGSCTDVVLGVNGEVTAPMTAGTVTFAMPIGYCGASLRVMSLAVRAVGCGGAAPKHRQRRGLRRTALCRRHMG